MNKKTVIAAVILAATACFASNQTAVAAGAYSKTSFNIDSVSLPANFIGNDPAAIYQSAAKIKQVKKSEFETKDQFEKRLKLETPPILYSGIGADQFLSFMPASPSLNASYEIRFDAELSQFNTIVKPNVYPIACPLQLIESRRKTGAFVGKNAFGAVSTVNKYEASHYCIADVDRAEFSFEMPAEVARLQKKNLRLLFIGKLKRPFYKEAGDYSSATISNPAEVIMHTYSINLQVQQIWAYNVVTGEIYYKRKMYIDPESN